MTTQTDNAVQTAVQTTTQPPLAEVMKNLDKKDKALAHKAISDAYTLQAGIEDMEAKIERNRGSIGDHVLRIAKAAREHCKAARYTLTLTRHYFLALCTEAETGLINAHIEKNEGEKKAISTLIPVWPTHKSNIAKGMELGVDPTDRMDDNPAAPKYATATQYVNAMKAMVGQTGNGGTGSQAGQQRKSNEEAAKIIGAVTSTWDSSLQAATQVLNQGLNRLDKAEQQLWAPKVLALAAEVTAYADSPQRKADILAREAARKYAPTSGQITEDGDGKVTGTTRSEDLMEQELDAGTQAALQAAIDKDESEPVKTETGNRRNRRGAKAA
jgi:hypothetical protein